MNENEFDLTARAWLDDGPTRMSDRALLSALEEIHTTRQRRAVWPARRATPVSMLRRRGCRRGPRGRGRPPGRTFRASRTHRASVVRHRHLLRPQAVDFPDLTTTFVSPRNGFSIKHPDRVSTHTGHGPLAGRGQVDGGFDVMETGLAAVFRGASMDFDAGPDGLVDEWVDDYVSPLAAGGCGVPRSQQAEITIDGQSGRIAECPNEIQATVIAEGGRLYVFTLSHERRDARAVFDTFAATIDLTPETAVDVPNMTTRPTFVSPTYGFSFKYIDRGGLTPAKELWDPVSQQINVDFDDRFDAVETGYSAYFEGASTEIPDGVSIDDWVDEYVSPLAAGGCGVPRSQQAEITIDGQSGRIAECAERVQATVVAGGRLYLFILSAARSDARAFFDAWIATIDLTPETAAVPSSTPSS